jgi:hypothetical protein
MGADVSRCPPFIQQGQVPKSQPWKQFTFQPNADFTHYDEMVLSCDSPVSQLLFGVRFAGLPPIVCDPGQTLPLLGEMVSIMVRELGRSATLATITFQQGNGQRHPDVRLTYPLAAGGALTFTRAVPDIEDPTAALVIPNLAAEVRVSAAMGTVALALRQFDSAPAEIDAFTWNPLTAMNTCEFRPILPDTATATIASFPDPAVARAAGRLQMRYRI